MNAHEKLIEQFYSAFNKLDYATMQLCYSDDIVFSDPVFEQLKGLQAKAMWHMLCESAKDLTVTATNISAEDNSGSCNWEATYTFSRTGRKVNNKITARFKFKDGKIVEHHDSFNLWKWSSMALGTIGLLLGWSPLVKNKVRKTAQKGLDKFMAMNPQYT